MSVVKINAITVPKERADELVARFAARAGEVSGSPGFEAFELLRPADDRDTFLVYTRWASEDDFQNWMNSLSWMNQCWIVPSWRMCSHCSHRITCFALFSACATDATSSRCAPGPCAISRPIRNRNSTPSTK